jgi:MSP (Major sperm protein) domain
MDKDWKKAVVINPIDVVFRDTRDSEGRPFSNIDIQNKSADAILFKVKTTDPTGYIVRPNQGIIPAEGSMNIKIQCL